MNWCLVSHLAPQLRVGVDLTILTM